jgi:hypothetical protein
LPGACECHISINTLLQQVYLFSAEGTAAGARRLRRFNARLPQATDSSNALLLATLKRRERRVPVNTY